MANLSRRMIKNAERREKIREYKTKNLTPNVGADAIKAMMQKFYRGPKIKAISRVATEDGDTVVFHDFKGDPIVQMHPDVYDNLVAQAKSAKAHGKKL